MQEIFHQCMYHMSEEISNGQLINHIFKGGVGLETQWRPPELGTLRMDVDASVRDHNNVACGGLIRDDRGRWIMGFQRKLETTSVTEAELLAIKTGLEVCQQLQIRNIWIYSDSLEAVNILLRDSGVKHYMREAIEATRHLLYAEWNVELFHANREALRCADIMAREAHDSNSHIRLLGEIPATCRESFLADKALVEESYPHSR